MTRFLDYIEKNNEKHLEELKDLLRIPSISAQKEHKKDILKASLWLKNHLKKIGMENAKVLKTSGHPIVYAEYLKAKGKPIILIYGHYDVQSPDPLGQWKSDPFEPEVRKGNLYSRGASDDKGQLFIHLKAIEAILKTDGKLPVNIKIFIEGEEEIGGPSLDKFILEKKKLLKSDICVISDTHSLNPKQPLIDYGLKGITYLQIRLSVMPKDAHSGLYGGNIPNAAVELTNILSKMKEEKNQKVLIPGFYENVRRLSKKEKAKLAKSPFKSEAVKSETGVKKVLGLLGFNVPERAGALPTFDINGIWGGYTGEGPKTIIPAEAFAKVSMRIVPYQTAKEIKTKFIKYLRLITPKYCKLTVEDLAGGEPILMDVDSKYFKLAENAFLKVFGNKPIYTLSGGSIPVTATIKKILGIDSILMGFGLPDDGLHSPNEKISLVMFYKGIKTSTYFLKSFCEF